MNATLVNRGFRCEDVPASEDSSKPYRLHLAITHETNEDGACYSVVVLNLPGVGSCGETEAEAIANAKDAVRAALEAYADESTAIPWTDPLDSENPTEASRKVIILNV